MGVIRDAALVSFLDFAEAIQGSEMDFRLRELRLWRVGSTRATT
jgi:hypothetical protein